MLARMREFLRTANQKAAAKRKHAKLAARRRDALANVKETLRQWRAAEDKCNCHDFTCWRDVWELDPLAAAALRASNHHVHGCHMKQTCPEDDLDFLCPQCGLVLLQPYRRAHRACRSSRSTPPGTHALLLPAWMQTQKINPSMPHLTSQPCPVKTLKTYEFAW